MPRRFRKHPLGPAVGMTRSRVFFETLSRRMRTCGQQNAPLVLFVTLSRLTRPSYPLRHNAAWERALPASAVSSTGRWFCAHAARAHPFLSRKGCKSDPRGAPLGYPPDGARCFPGSMGGDFSPNPGGQHHWIPPGCSEKSSASAETAHAPAESKTRTKSRLRRCTRCPQLCFD